MACKKVIGEKCPQCGDEAKPVLPPFAVESMKGTFEVKLFICMNPRCWVVHFNKGTGGRTDGLCGECKTKMLLGEIVPK